MIRSGIVVGLSLALAWAAPQDVLEVSWHEAAPPLRGELRDLALRPVLKPAPEHVVLGPEGDTALFADFRGKLVLLNFWATWCPPCVREMPSLDRLEGKLGGGDFEVIALSLDRAAEGVLDDFFEALGRRNIPYTPVRQRKAMRVYRLGGLPTTLVVSPEGELVATLAGPADWDSPEAEALVRHLIRSWKTRTR